MASATSTVDEAVAMVASTAAEAVAMVAATAVEAEAIVASNADAFEFGILKQEPLGPLVCS